MFSKALVILASISAAFAVPFITQPVASTTFQAGKEAVVKWQDDGNTPTLANYGPCLISIYVGNAKQQLSLQTLSNSTNVATTSELSFTPSASIGPNSGEYFIRIQSISFKDPAQPQYPALAFSAKFTLSGMTGTFSADAQSLIKGQSTAPLALPSGSTSPSSGPSPTSGFTTSTSKIPSSTSVPSSTVKTSAAESVLFHRSWIGFLLSTFFGVTML